MSELHHFSGRRVHRGGAPVAPASRPPSRDGRQVWSSAQHLLLVIVLIAAAVWLSVTYWCHLRGVTGEGAPLAVIPAKAGIQMTPVASGARRGVLPAVDTPAPAAHSTIVFMTDFGTDNDAVPICKGVIWSIVPGVRVVDLTHQVTAYSILDGARFLFGTTPYYPPGTIFLVVIDPTVGSSRKAVVVKSRRGQYFVLPDNGLITLVQDRDPLEGAREITNPDWMIGSKRSSTFHGRDIFSPAAAHLARGDDWTQIGPEIPVESLVRLNIPKSQLSSKGITGLILALDYPFGSLISNIEGGDFAMLGYAPGDRVPVTLGSRRIVLRFVKTFSDVPLGKPLLYIDSRGHLGLAVNQDSFSRIYSVKPPASIFVPRKAH